MGYSESSGHKRATKEIPGLEKNESADTQVDTIKTDKIN